MKPGRKPNPTALRRARVNPGKRGCNAHEPDLSPAMPDCPLHLSDLAVEEGQRIAVTLHEAGVLIPAPGSANQDDAEMARAMGTADVLGLDICGAAGARHQGQKT